jgi:sugar transferase (PEP-CTERM/EpsH1 system associated)
MVERLRRHHDVRCIAFVHDEDDERGARALRDQGIAITTVYHRRAVAWLKAAVALFGRQPLTTALLGSNAMRAAVAAEMTDADIAVAFSSSMGAYLLDWPEVPSILHFCELDSDKWRQYARHTNPPLKWVYAREAKTLLRLEHRLAATMSASLVCTQVEAAVFRSWIKDSTCLVMRNGIDLDYFSPAGLDPQPGELVFTGVMNYYPNVDGCCWFAREVLPLVATAVPAAHLTIVGANPTRTVMNLARDPRITVTGRVPETRPYLRRASVVIAPLRMARGIQNKVLEGMSMGLPIVATTAATQGIGGMSGVHYIVSDDPTTMSEAIIQLFSHDGRRAALGKSARAFVEMHHHWEDTLEPLTSLVQQLSEKRPA